MRHPNVVSVLGVEAHGDRVAPLHGVRATAPRSSTCSPRGMLSAREATLVGEDVCRALAAVHLAGFVHRDVKARNVMRETAAGSF